MNAYKKILSAFTCISLLFSACTDLEPEVFDQIDGGEIISESAELLSQDTTLVENYLSTAYNQLYQFLDEREIYALTEVTTDEMVVPTRGTDWADNGLWLQLHEHSWNADNEIVQSAWDGLSRGVARSFEVRALFDDFVIQKPELGEFLIPYQAELNTVMAYYAWQYVDLFGVLPILDENLDVTVLEGSDAADYVIDLLETSIPDMIAKRSMPVYGRAVKETAHALAAKAYLNRFIYNNESAASGEDMDKVIEHCNAVINSGSYAIAGDYFSLFESANETSTESLLVMKNQDDLWNYAHTTTRTLMSLHYNQRAQEVDYAPWNGMSVTQDFFNSWDDDQNSSNGILTTDQRFQNDRYLEVFGLHLGMLYGQQTDAAGAELTDNQGNPLVFTAEINDIRRASETEGVRVVKWAPDGDSPSPFQADNDIALLRYSDVILMKAEAQWRKGSAAEAIATINELRLARGATEITGIDGNGSEVLRERGYELYWEGHRRTDLIRFNQFTQGTWFAKNISSQHYEVFPIPTKALAANQLLSQNPGY